MLAVRNANYEHTSEDDEGPKKPGDGFQRLGKELDGKRGRVDGNAVTGYLVSLSHMTLGKYIGICLPVHANAREY